MSGIEMASAQSQSSNPCLVGSLARVNMLTGSVGGAHFRVSNNTRDVCYKVDALNTRRRKAYSISGL
jgi:hypothetical protein